MLALVSRVPGRLIRTAAPARRFAGHGHGDGKYTFDRASPNHSLFLRVRTRLPGIRVHSGAGARRGLTAGRRGRRRGHGHGHAAAKVLPELRHAQAVVPGVHEGPVAGAAVPAHGAGAGDRARLARVPPAEGGAADVRGGDWGAVRPGGRVGVRLDRLPGAATFRATHRPVAQTTRQRAPFAPLSSPRPRPDGGCARALR